MISNVNTAVYSGIEGRNVKVEIDISNGLPYMNIVGLASTTIMESKERVKSAIVHSGFDYPRGRITVNLTPAGLRKNGSYLDLPMAIGVLTASKYVDQVNVSQYGLVGELSLDGRVLEIDGVLPMIMSMYKEGIERIIIPADNYVEASIIEGPSIIPVNSLKGCVDLINDGVLDVEMPRVAKVEQCEEPMLDFADICGQENAKRAISIAVAGRHGLIMIGSPGCGKTMLARRIPSIMPEMTAEERLETAVINSVASGVHNATTSRRPFRAPHNSIARAGLLGGGNYPIPGEITLAHNGVLFLDEACEFDRECIQSLRQPIEDREIIHFRHGTPYYFPCNFQLVMAANPCPCGYYGDPDKMCKCSVGQIDNYKRKLSGPILDRIDLRLVMDRVSFSQINKEDNNRKSSKELREDVERGINFARSRGRNLPNSLIPDRELDSICALGQDEKNILRDAYSRLKLSPRSYNKVLRVARTIADMDESEKVKLEHIAEALSYRTLDSTSIDEEAIA